MTLRNTSFLLLLQKAQQFLFDRAKRSKADKDHLISIFLFGSNKGTVSQSSSGRTYSTRKHSALRRNASDFGSFGFLEIGD
jgi:hypothetical protein